MRVTLILLCLIAFQLQAEDVYSQKMKISLDMKNASVEKVLQTIEEKSDYYFLYNNRLINADRKVSINVKDVPVSEILDKIFESTDVQYQLEGNQIILSPKEKMDKAASDIETVQQQNKRKITGIVTDAKGEPIIGANIIEVGTNNGTVTNIDGKFSLSVSDNATIRVSYIGYVDQEIKTAGKTNFQVTLQENVKALDEVVVVGYGTMKKSDLTGAISSVDKEKLGKRDTYNLSEALQGQIAGVNIQKFGGNAGSGLQMKIRGIKTFGNNEPLYIIDGFPGDINNVNPQDISSMEVLKDAAAAAIYGSRAANGVVLISTKNGEKGGIKVDFNSFLSFTDIAKRLEFLNANEYKKVHKQMYENWNMYASEEDQITLPTYINKDSKINTDWQKAMERNGLTQNYSINIRGASDKSNYSISYNRVNDKGIFLGNDFRQDNARIKLGIEKNIFQLETVLARNNRAL